VNVIETKPEEGAMNGEVRATRDYTPDYEEEDLANADEGVPLSRLLVILFSFDHDDQSQRHKIFHTHCTINRRAYDVIITGGNGKNVVSKEMVSKLGLKTDVGWKSQLTSFTKNAIFRQLDI
jgi:hypothetical protein